MKKKLIIAAALSLICISGVLAFFIFAGSNGLKTDEIGEKDVAESTVDSERPVVQSNLDYIESTLAEYIESEEIPATVHREPERVAIGYDGRNKEARNKIDAFIKEKHIDQTKVCYDVLE